MMKRKHGFEMTNCVIILMLPHRHEGVSHTEVNVLV